LDVNVKGNSPNDVKLCLLMILRLQLEATITPVGRSFQLVHQSMSLSLVEQIQQTEQTKNLRIFVEPMPEEEM
jgi:hypothetical protein